MGKVYISLRNFNSDLNMYVYWPGEGLQSINVEAIIPATIQKEAKSIDIEKVAQMALRVHPAQRCELNACSHRFFLSFFSAFFFCYLPSFLLRLLPAFWLSTFFFFFFFFVQLLCREAWIKQKYVSLNSCFGKLQNDTPPSLSSQLLTILSNGHGSVRFQGKETERNRLFKPKPKPNRLWTLSI